MNKVNNFIKIGLLFSVCAGANLHADAIFDLFKKDCVNYCFKNNQKWKGTGMLETDANTKEITYACDCVLPSLLKDQPVGWYCEATSQCEKDAGLKCCKNQCTETDTGVCPK